jgi:hypothetical protein
MIMTDLEQRLLNKKHRTSIKSGDKNAAAILAILKKGIMKKSYNLRGRPSNWSFSLTIY